MSGRTIHRLAGGLPPCGFSREVPGNWPAGHVWTNDPEEDFRQGFLDKPAGDFLCPGCWLESVAAGAPIARSPAEVMRDRCARFLEDEAKRFPFGESMGEDPQARLLRGLATRMRAFNPAEVMAEEGVRGTIRA